MTDHEVLAAAMAPRLALLRVLAAEQHVTRAADRLGVPQPTVSRWLAGLSAELGTPVIVRAGRGVRLTRAGRLLADAAEQALSTLEAGCRRAMGEADPERGQVVFAFLHTMGGVRVPELLRDFRARHPHVRFTLEQGAHEEMLARVRAGDTDLALTSPLPVEDPELCSAPVYEQPLALNVPIGHALAERRRVRLAELAHERFVGVKRGYGLRRTTDELCAAAGFVPELAFEGEEVDTVRGLVAAGLGVALLPLADTNPVGVLELPITPRAIRRIGLVWSATVPLAPAADLFRASVLAEHADR
ncbi:LysR family transcriptional regulator [Kutzneria viridogrisea]|uniref:Transcription regulator n=2 Tax=Kutzneria TaxID=43356 RepID=W5W1B5_9PSEU|nr:LysR family transcriptional regulator [Kutzneria albida]AHH94326.1 transcription regulator [Kutzneria albida DSM 43870]MBA8929991.1 DNA-binding transcriptional LysR family regulator [Kutzneria viridogrisea]